MNVINTLEVKAFPYSHCHHCGTPYENAEWPRKCPKCGDMRWHNPTPIGVLLQTVTDGTKIGVLTPVRGHGPQLGCEGLTGGFEEASDDGVDDAAIREYKEEIRHNIPDRSKVELLLSRGSGPLYPPGRRQSLTFSVNPDPIHIDEFKNWEPDAETTALEFSWTPRVLAFPTHTLALAEYFRRYQGVNPPAHYIDQPRTNDLVMRGAKALPIYNVVYEQPLLDNGIWRVQLSQDGPHVDISRIKGKWHLLSAIAHPVHPMPDREDIERIKREWISDPCWDLEDTPGYEAVRTELHAFVSMIMSHQKTKVSAKILARAEQLGCSIQVARHIIQLEERLQAVEKNLPL